jgi:hypothetical protein
MQMALVKKIDSLLGIVFSLALFFIIPAIFIFDINILVKVTALASLIATILVLKALVFSLESQLQKAAELNQDPKDHHATHVLHHGR